jgi:hypothetical protein
MIRAVGLVVLGVLAAGGFASDRADAMSMQQAMAQCKEQLSPLVRECVRSKMGGQRGDPSQYIPGCPASVMGGPRPAWPG